MNSHKLNYDQISPVIFHTPVLPLRGTFNPLISKGNKRITRLEKRITKTFYFLVIR